MIRITFIPHARIDIEEPSQPPRKRLKRHWMAVNSYETHDHVEYRHPRRAMLAAYRARDFSDTSSTCSSSSSTAFLSQHNAASRAGSPSSVSHITATPSTPVKLPNRRQTPDTPIFRFLWTEHDKSRLACNESVKAIKDIVDERDRRCGLPARRRTEAQALEDLWVEGPRATGAAVTYHKAKRRFALVQSLMVDQLAKYNAPPDEQFEEDSELATEDPSNSPSPSPIVHELPALPPKPLNDISPSSPQAIAAPDELIQPLTNDISQAAASIRSSRRLRRSPEAASQPTPALKRSHSPADDDHPVAVPRKRAHLS